MLSVNVLISIRSGTPICHVALSINVGRAELPARAEVSVAYTGAQILPYARPGTEQFISQSFARENHMFSFSRKIDTANHYLTSHYLAALCVTLSKRVLLISGPSSPRYLPEWNDQCSVPGATSMNPCNRASTCLSIGDQYMGISA